MKCKVLNLRLSTICIILCLTLFEWAVPVIAQQAGQRNVTGIITDETNSPMVGVNILVVGTTTGTITDIDGKYSIMVPVGKNELRISYIGYETVTVAIPANNVLNYQLKMQSSAIGEIVVIGYGTSKKGDLTGSVSNVTSKDFNKGIISSPEQLINGKISGVQITSNNGSPTSGSTIRIRGGASLRASNDPLIVVDGIPLEHGGISGNDNNFLSLINPNDIESITILKDASSAAIYGSRASNGVVMITTKKASGDKIKINFSSTHSFQVKTKLADMLSAQEFRDVVESEGTAEQIALLGNSDTDWNNEIYKTAYGTDNNLSASGLIKKVPVRGSFGYYNQDGILRSDKAKRINGSISVSPVFLDEHLKVTIGVKGSWNKNYFANTNAIWGGATFNPTLPVYSGSSNLGGYTEAIDETGKPVTSAVYNPVGLLKQYSSQSNVNRFISNLDVEYKLHFLPDVKFHSTLGYDYAEGEGKIYVPETSAAGYLTGGQDYKYGPQKKGNRLLTTYLNYNKNLENINSTLDMTAGYDYQFWKDTRGYFEEFKVNGERTAERTAFDRRHALISIYGRLNYAFASRYMLTASIRRDWTSRFDTDYRSGTFPSVALAWRISEESIIKNLNIFSNLKVRASYGITGQQEGIGDYGYLPIYTLSQAGAQYNFGSRTVNTYRPEAYVGQITWETTEAFNYGVDVGFFKDRLSGSFDYYTRKTRDLFASVSPPAGTNLEKIVTTNVGNVESEGYEVTLNATPVDNKDITWNFSFNGSWQKQTIKNLSVIKGNAVNNSLAGPTIDSYQFQVLSNGYSPYMFWVYHQLYDENNKPIEGAYADIKKDGQINTDDLYRYHSRTPDYVMGFSTSFRLKKVTLSTSLRAYIGNYIYNGMAMNTGALGTMSYNAYQLNNLNKSYLKTGFRSRQYLSDYYVENASFLKMDNLMITYNVGNITKWCNLNVTGMIQNVFTITEYSGVDPEVTDGMDNSFYLRPRIFSINLGLDF